MKRHVPVLVLLALLLAACGHELRPAEAPHVQLISASYPVAEIRAALVRALERRKFTAEREEEGRILARFQRKGEAAHVSLDYSQTQWAVRYVDSSGLGETRDAGGALMVDKRYEDLVSRLDKAIDEELKRPAKERAAVERQEREYQAMMQLARTAQAGAEAQAANGSANAEADPAQAQPGADPAQGNAPTVINRTFVQNNVQNVQRTQIINSASPASPQFCDRAVKAMWVCPSTPALNACMKNRGQCSSLCRVGRGC
jgi:hypothetical protein